MKCICFVFVGTLLWNQAGADDFISQERDVNIYNYVSNYEIMINSTSDVVWRNLINLRSWMYAFELSHYSGRKGKVGEILRLYPNQEFFVQVTGMVESKLLTIVNLPSTFNGENSTGVGVISISSNGSTTAVSLTMSRRYEWVGEGENLMRKKRESSEFQNSTAEMWNKFLSRLKKTSEKT